MDKDVVRAMLREEAERGSQAMLAEHLDVAEATISRWINGTRWPTQGPTRVRLMEWAERKKFGTVKEPADTRGAVMAQGRGVELEALMAYVLTRQQMLNEYMRQIERSVGAGPVPAAR